MSNSSASVYVRVRSPEASSPFELPESSESVAAVEWCGFTYAKSHEIFTRWVARPNPEQNPDDLLK